MKRMKKLVCATMMFVFVMAGTAHAMSLPSWDSLAEETSQSVLLSDNQVKSKDTTQNVARGTVFSAGMIEISNEQDGTLYISVDTFAHKTVDKIYQTVFLDVWDEENETWKQLKYWDFERSIEEEDDLTSYHVGFIVSGCELNRYYRARAMHLVQWGDHYEGKATETNGVLLTDHEVQYIIQAPNNINILC